MPATGSPVGQAGPEQTYDEMHLDPEIQRALDALPADFRVAVVLCDLEQLSYEEIAATLGVKVGTVRSRIHRGRVLLRQALAHRAPGSRPAEPGVKSMPDAATAAGQVTVSANATAADRAPAGAKARARRYPSPSPVLGTT